MADRIYKYGPFEDVNTPIEIRGTPVKVGRQGSHPVWEKIYCWCRVAVIDGEVINPPKKVMLIPTGEDFTGVYVDTLIEDNGLVWHLIEE
jgi:hypothetical protein